MCSCSWKGCGRGVLLSAAVDCVPARLCAGVYGLSGWLASRAVACRRGGSGPRNTACRPRRVRRRSGNWRSRGGRSAKSTRLSRGTGSRLVRDGWSLSAARQRQTPDFADYGVFAEAEAPRDFARRDAFVPERAQSPDIVVVPDACRFGHGALLLLGIAPVGPADGGPRKGAVRRPARPLRGTTPAGIGGFLMGWVGLASGVVLAAGRYLPPGAGRVGLVGVLFALGFNIR